MKWSGRFENTFIGRKNISQGENNFMQNKCNKWMKYRNVPPKHKNYNMRSFEIYFHGVDMTDMQFQN